MTATATAYPAAQDVAPILHQHFVTHVEAARRANPTHEFTPVPSIETIKSSIDAAFWASLRRDENYIPRISLALLPPERSTPSLVFARSMPLTTTTLVRIAAAVERPGIHLGVWPVDGELRVWGAARGVPEYCFVLEVAAPGLLVVKHHRGEAGKFVNVAVLEGDQVKVIDEQASSLPDCPPLLTSLLGFEAAGSWAGTVNVLVQLAVSMRTHGRGGAMLVVPAGSDSWQESIVRPAPYTVAPPYSELAALTRQEEAERVRRRWQDALAEAVSAVAGLTAVDGATILTTSYDVLVFGAKIARRDGSPQVEQVAVTEPIQGSSKAVMHPNRLGGTRHLSAAQFVHDQRDSIALVASQDGRFTVFAWSPCEELVHAHRVETLLL
jgi:hypothetical protein